MRWFLILWLLWPVQASAQSKVVQPSEVSLAVTVEDVDHELYAREMVLITIRGIYRRHITREILSQPDLTGFSWTQLGPDSWTEDRIDGRKVKIFTRRMAIYPDHAGTLTIGAFTHNLTLTDESDDWFEHQVKSAPTTITVAPAPAQSDRWFPVRQLKISDEWSNAPDLLQPGEGVLRVVRLEALGATPEMIPPMPELTSPSAIIFPHPEKRLLDLTSQGPITHAFWRWTIRPSNDVSAIVEPLEFSFFNTQTRQHQKVVINAQRVAYGVVPDEGPGPEMSHGSPPQPVRLPGWPLLLIGVGVFAGALCAGLSGRKTASWQVAVRGSWFDPMARALRKAARQKRAEAVRRIAGRILARDGHSMQRTRLLRAFDDAYFSPDNSTPDLLHFARRFLRAGDDCDAALG